MSEGNVIFSKIAATPTDTAWSQAYSAGKLFTVLSLKNEASEEEKESLKVLGKNILDTLETEFFSLEEKSLESVKGAILEAIKGIPDDLQFSFVTTVLSNNVLYVYIVGAGRVYIKRGSQFGYVLQSEDDSKEISSASGHLQNGDLIILATEDFSKTISKDQLISSLEAEVPSEIAENLAPTIHESEEAGAAAIILSFKEDITPPTAIEEESEPAAPPAKEEEPEYVSERNEKSNPLAFLALFAGLKKLIPSRLNHSKKIYLTVAGLIFLVLIASVILGIKKQNNAKIAAEFNAVYPVAQKKFDEGESLKDLNRNLAMDNFIQAKKLLEENKNKFSANSKEEKQINILLTKVNTEIENNSPEKIAASLDRSKITITVENGSGAEGVAGIASDFLEEKGYKVSSTANADNYKYIGVTIKVKSSGSAYLDLLKKDLAEKYTVSLTASDLSSGSPTDSVVIIGK